MSKSRIIGWERILPELAVFFIALKMRARREHDLTPFNLFLSGKPGTNKTEGLLHLLEHLGYSAGIIDCSTIDDVAELAGVIDIYANRELGKAKLIEGELLDKDVLILDEFLNARAHVVPQFRLMLQGKLVLLAKHVSMKTKCFVATANLSEDMDVGEANVLDSPTADRFAMLIDVPSFADFNTGEKDAIIEGRPGNGFEDDLRRAIEDATKQYSDEQFIQSARFVTQYVRTVAEHLAKTPLSFEGRRAQLLRQFVAAAFAMGADELKLREHVSRAMHACLSVPKLTGQDLKLDKLQDAHKEGEAFLSFALLSEEELEVFGASDLGQQVKALLKHFDKVSLPTKIDVCQRVMESNDTKVQLALLELLGSDVFAKEPVEFKEVAIELNKVLATRFARRAPPDGYEKPYEQYADFSYSRAMALRASGGDLAKFKALMEGVKNLLQLWPTTKMAMQGNKT